MGQKILIVGGGFAGLWSALSAARLLDAEGKSETVEVALISPEPVLHMRPRLHETEPHLMRSPFSAHLAAVGVRYIQGRVDRIHAENGHVEAITSTGERISVEYDRLLLAAGSTMHRPEVPGLHAFGFSVDQYDDAVALDRHLEQLAYRPQSQARDTVIVVGGGFTGIEVAAEMRSRLRAALGETAAARVILIERSSEVGPDLGPGPRPVIQEALAALGVECLLGSSVVSLDADGVITASGTRIESSTVIWTGGVRASSLGGQIGSTYDHLGRLHVTPDLRVEGTSSIFAAGDVALAATDDEGNHSMMSCQHAINMGRFAGHNVAAHLLGLSTVAYRQPNYVTCLDLGDWGAVYTEGWNRTVRMKGAQAKALKKQINTEWIYPPQAERTILLAAADWRNSVVA